MEDEKKEVKVTETSCSSEVSSLRQSTTWGNDTVQDDDRRRLVDTPVALSLLLDSTKQRAWFFFNYAKYQINRHCSASSGFLRTNRRRWLWSTKVRKQILALLLLLTCGILPFVLIGILQPAGAGNGFYEFVFEPKVMACGYSFGEPQYATATGIESLFVLDKTFGRYSFSQVKIIDVLWDLFVGRGAQLFAWWVAYKVFTDALLRIIERQATSLILFMTISLDGPSLGSLWTLFKDLFRAKSKRTWALFFFMFLSTAYVLVVPTFIGAISGYDSTTIAWVEIDTNNIIPVGSFHQRIVVFGTLNETFKNPTCSASDQIEPYDYPPHNLGSKCDCKYENGTVVPSEESQSDSGHDYSYTWSYDSARDNDCYFNFTGNTQTYTRSDDPEAEPLNCNGSATIHINNKDYDLAQLDYDRGLCYGNTGYRYDDLSGKSRCLPDTANPSYAWGFSTMLSGVFILTNLVWCLAMYAIWQDAQFNSKLVQSGYGMTQLRAAFALTLAAKRKTGLTAGQLVEADRKEIEDVLFGGKQKKGAEIDSGYFRDQRTSCWGRWGTAFRRRVFEEDEDV